MSRFYDLMTGSVRALTGETHDVPAPTDPTAAPTKIKLDANESPYGPSPRALAAIRGTVGHSNKYPDDRAVELSQRLAEKHGVEPDQILVGPGSTALLSVIARTMLEPGLKAVTSERSFIVYRYATRAAGAELVEVPMHDDRVDPHGILEAIDEHTRVVFLANPNNPTGTFLDAHYVDGLVARIPTHVVVVLDEAYYDYAHFFANARGVAHPDSLRYVREARNVVVLRTFSKAHGLAALRVGYGIGPAELMSYFANMQDAFAVSTVAQAAAAAALEDEPHVQHALQQNAAQAEWLETELTNMGFRVLPTWANFLYCDLGRDCEAIAQRLHEEGISIRPLAAWGALTAARITIGTIEQNRALISSLRRGMSQSAGR
jgi:histidinol-phosphate aminotransferase